MVHQKEKCKLKLQQSAQGFSALHFDGDHELMYSLVAVLGIVKLILFISSFRRQIFSLGAGNKKLILVTFSSLYAA